MENAIVTSIYEYEYSWLFGSKALCYSADRTNKQVKFLRKSYTYSIILRMRFSWCVCKNNNGGVWSS